MFNLQHPFFVPLWRRILTSALVAGWALFELLTNSPGWAAMFGALAIWTIYTFFITFDSDTYKDNDHG